MSSNNKTTTNLKNINLDNKVESEFKSDNNIHKSDIIELYAAYNFNPLYTNTLSSRLSSPVYYTHTLEKCDFLNFTHDILKDIICDSKKAKKFVKNNNITSFDDVVKTTHNQSVINICYVNVEMTSQNKTIKSITNPNIEINYRIKYMYTNYKIITNDDEYIVFLREKNSYEIDNIYFSIYELHII